MMLEDHFATYERVIDEAIQQSDDLYGLNAWFYFFLHCKIFINKLLTIKKVVLVMRKVQVRGRTLTQ